MLVILPSPIQELKHTPLPPQVLRARERILILYFSIVFSLDSYLSPSRSLGVHHNISSFFLLIFFGDFWQKNYVGMLGHYGSRVMRIYSRPLGKVLGLITNLLWCISFIYMEDYVPIIFLRSWVLVALYLCSKFCIFNRPVLKEYVSQVERSPYLL